MVDADNMHGEPVRGTPKSDFPVRLASSVIMIALAGAACYFGGLVFDSFVAIVALITLVEFVVLVVKATSNIPYRLASIIGGAAYISVAAFVLAQMEAYYLIAAIGTVIATDTGGYFAGRTIGGPKIAKRISPSKTWAGLIGAMLLAAVWLIVWTEMFPYFGNNPGARDEASFGPVATVIAGAALAVLAQIGDFFESWLKRRAGAKDSSKLIPGHGGVFDRVDGLLPVALVVGIVSAQL